MLGPITVDSTSASFPIIAGWNEFAASGSFGSGTLSLQRSTDGGTTWIPIGAASNLAQLTASGTIGFLCASGLVRVVMLGSTSPSVVYSVLRASTP